MTFKMFGALKWCRRVLGCAFFVLLVLGFYDPPRFSWLSEILMKIQFGQVLAAFFSAGALYAVWIFVIYLILTCLWGRLFCGFLCPLGFLMDLVVLLREKSRPLKYRFLPNRPWRYFVPLTAVVLFWIGFTLPFGWLEPYSIFASKSLIYEGPGLILGLVLLLAYLRGRAFCNSLCPTGFVLRLFAKFSLYRINISKSCLNCKVCEKKCAASLINVREKVVDFDRCVVCFTCLDACPNGSITFSRVKSQENLEDSSPKLVRRSFLRQAGLGALTGLAFVTPDTLRGETLSLPASTPILPPGALSLAHLSAHCTLCHSCVRVCPNEALIVSRTGGPSLFNKPVLDPYQGFCQYECVLCTEICPTGALINLSVEEKKYFRLGVVHLHLNQCIVVKNKTSCGACAELCPTGAVYMEKGQTNLFEPKLRRPLCIGCGACQKACPVRPVSPIWVVGLKFQDMFASRPIQIHQPDEIPEEEFPF
ncbi:MAG: 4Fe-4S dicluster domain-containing protein [Deltaproteobacteria bacterium]|jgi:polyferredoxin|nr:4Fe-4S dicluster domain-containing protein [Deltaproteobacteria bacterium]